MKKINVSDITLKKLSEDRAVSLLFREKSAIAKCADEIGADVIELPAVKSPREDKIIYKTIAQNIKNAVLAIPVGFSKEDVAVAWECIKEAKNPRLQIEVPVSTIQMEYTYHVKQEKMLAKIAELIKEAKSLCADVEFSALDATRADADFLIAAVKEAQASGANVITICDNAGISTPDEIAELTTMVKEAVDVPVFVQVSDHINMAVACAFAAIKNNADGLKCAMAGKDVLLTGELSDAINACATQLSAEISVDKTKIHASIDDITTNINNSSYTDEDTVSEEKSIILDVDSTVAQVAQAATVLGYELSDSDVGNVHKALKHVCAKKGGSVGSKELEALIASSAMQAPSTYHFETYTTTSSNATSSMSQVTLKCNGEIICGVSGGDGPIDSAFRAIEQCIGHHYELDDFQVQAVTEGKGALGSALVKLRNNGKLYSGNGTSTDIVSASIRAYINALNKIVFEEA
jgi:2-isopropylmalate synthase